MENLNLTASPTCTITRVMARPRKGGMERKWKENISAASQGHQKSRLLSNWGKHVPGDATVRHFTMARSAGKGLHTQGGRGDHSSGGVNEISRGPSGQIIRQAHWIASMKTRARGFSIERN